MAEEKNFENRIKEFLKSRGVWHVKYFANRNTKAGIPDILACVGGRFVAVEVKASKGVPSLLQKYNIEKIRECGGIAILLYPDGFETFKNLIDSLLEENNGGEKNEIQSFEG